MAKNFKVVKLDGRYKGGDAFKYLIDYRVVDKTFPDPHNIRLYQDFFLSNHRIWLWDTYAQVLKLILGCDPGSKKKCIT
jgi:hypothetical protein